MSPAEARLKEVPSGMTDDEWSQRVNLAARYRLVALLWLGRSGRYPHLRAGAGTGASFPDQPLRLMFDEITASSLVKVDLDGNQLTQSELQHQPGRLHHPLGDP